MNLRASLSNLVRRRSPSTPSLRRALPVGVLAVAGALFPVLARGLAAQETRLALVHGQLVDGYEAPPIHDAVVVIRGERIEAAGRAGEVDVPDDARILDVGGRTVLPGLIDLHAHLDILGHGNYLDWFDWVRKRDRWQEVYAVSARQLLEAGVTTALDLAAPLDILETRERIRRGAIPGPRIRVSGPWITRVPMEGVPLEIQNVISSPDEAARAARELIDGGADVIKVWVGLTESDYRAVVEVAEERGVRVHAHLYDPGAIRAALDAGVHVLQHVGSGGNPRYEDDLVLEIAHRGVPVVQTIAHRIWVWPATLEFPGRIRDPRLRETMPREMYDEVLRSLENFRTLGYFHTTPRQIRNAEAAARQFVDANVRMGVGTDSGTPLNFHTEAMWREMAALVESGMTPLQVISAATKTNAEILGMGDELGTVEPGKLADLIVVEGNPLRDVDALGRVGLVIKGGVVWKGEGR